MNTSRRKRLKANLADAGLMLLTFAVFVGLWEYLVRGLAVPEIVLPTPSAIALALWKSLVGGELLEHVGVTLFEVLSGFLIGAIGGLAIGFAVALSPLAEKLFYPYVIAFQTVPKVALAPIIVIWFGYGLTSKVIITAMIAFFPVLANAIMGLRAAPADQLEMMKTYTASRWQVFYMVRLKQALPYIFVGLDVAIVLAVIGAIVGEFVGAKAGLGFLILQKNFNFDMAGTFAVLVVLSLIGVGLHAIISAIQRRVVFWMDVSGKQVTGA
jgi:NitT/TauT family transport system permease protein